MNLLNENDPLPVTVPMASYMAWLKKVQARKWHWSRNSECKHLVVTMDTRSDVVHIRDRKGNVITPKQLHYQTRTSLPAPVIPRINRLKCQHCNDSSSEEYMLGMCCGSPMVYMLETDFEYNQRLRFIKARGRVLAAAALLDW